LIQPQSPVIVKIISPPKDESGLSQLADVLIGSLGLTGAIVLVALLLGTLMAGLLFLWRRWQDRRDGHSESPALRL
jgi:hypothetical protein